MAERNAALRAAFAELPPRCQQLLSMLVSDPPHSYAEIHAKLGIPVGSIGPQRARCLERMRRSSASRRPRRGRGQDRHYGEASQVRNDWDDDRLPGGLEPGAEGSRGRSLVVHRDGQRTLSPGITSRPSWRSSPTTPTRTGQEAAVMRSETASIRALTFTSAHLSAGARGHRELAARPASPGAGGRAGDPHQGGRDISTTEVDEIGCFSVDPIPTARSGCAATRPTAPTC